MNEDSIPPLVQGIAQPDSVDNGHAPDGYELRTIPSAQVNPGELAAYQPLASQHVVMEQRVGYVVSLVAGFIGLAIGGPVLWLTQDSIWIASSIVVGCLVLLGLLVWSSHSWPRIEHRHTRWRLTDVGMEIRRGVLWRHRIAIPLARVQHVDVSQGPIQRMYELGKLTVYTAGTKNAAVELDGLEHSLALTLRDQLIAQKDSLDVT